MSNDYSATLIASLLFFGMLTLLEAGRRIGVKHSAHDAEKARAGLGAVDGSIFGMLGLLIAFTFSGAASRFEQRRYLVVEEANNIGTAYLRLDLLPTSTQAALRELFRQYVDSRLATYRKLPDIPAAMEELAKSSELQREIWKQCVEAARDPRAQQATMLLLPALNNMFDITTTRTEAARTHPPEIVYIMLSVLALVSSLLAGYGMAGGKQRSWIHIASFASIVALTIYVILDLEYPRVGLIRLDRFDQVLVELREGMK